jgi:uncharacterized protein YjbJ (UPF0337 family)
MNQDILKGKWKELKGETKAKWGKLTDDDLQEIDGNFEKLVGFIQREYGKGRDEAKKDVDEWMPAN